MRRFSDSFGVSKEKDNSIKECFNYVTLSFQNWFKRISMQICVDTNSVQNDSTDVLPLRFEHPILESQIAKKEVIR